MQDLQRLECHGILPFGDARVDRCLSGGGLALGNLHEIAATGIEAETGAVTAGFVASLLARLTDPRPIFWIGLQDKIHEPDLYMPGLLGYGLDPDRLILVGAPTDTATLGAMEVTLHEGTAAVVLGEVGRLNRLATRRLQLACRKHGSTGFLLRRWPWGHRATERDESNSAVTRWLISPVPSASEHQEPGLPRWHVRLTHARGGIEGAWILEAGGADAPHPVRVVAELANPAASSHGHRLAG